MATRSYARAIALEPRLGDPRYNPHLIENQLASQAMITSYSRYLTPTSAPRAYAERDRLARALVGGRAATPAGTGAGAAPTPAPKATPTAKSAPATAPLPASLPPPGELSSAETGEKGEAEEMSEGGYLEVRVLDESTLQPGLGVGQVVGPGAGAGTGGAAPGFDEPPAARRPGVRTPRGGRPAPAGPPPVPTGTFSTGRLDVELLPAASRPS
jgi:hypothetical protein